MTGTLVAQEILAMSAAPPKNKLSDAAKVRQLEARVRELETALQWCRNLTHRQETSPATVRDVGLRVEQIVKDVLGKI